MAILDGSWTLKETELNTGSQKTQLIPELLLKRKASN